MPRPCGCRKPSSTRACAPDDGAGFIALASLLYTLGLALFVNVHPLF